MIISAGIAQNAYFTLMRRNAIYSQR